MPSSNITKSPMPKSSTGKQESKNANSRNQGVQGILLFSIAIVAVSIVSFHNWMNVDEQMKLLQHQVAEMKASHAEMKASHEKMKLVNAAMQSEHTEEITKLKAALQLSSNTEKNSMMSTKELLDNSESNIEERIPSAPATTTSNVRYHIVFSTSCNNQDWQSYVMFYHALKSGQSGTVTRVASGCSEEAGEKLRELHHKEIEPMLSSDIIYPYKNNHNSEKKHDVDGFYLHLTPDYTYVKPGANYKYFNKAFGIRHWLDHGIKYAQNSEKYDNDIFIILDPDQIPARPFAKDMSPNKQKNVLFRPATTKAQQYKIQHGIPVGQEYGFSSGYEWFPKVNMSYVVTNTTSVNELPSPINSLTRAQGQDGYPVGPPYAMTGRDFNKLVHKWAEFAPQVYDERPGHITEMHAYSIAAAHLNLSHTIMNSYMISAHNEQKTEGWQLIDENFGESEVCMHPERDNYYLDWNKLPFTLHFCKRYMLGKWFFNKYFVEQDMISCEAPLMAEPPVNVVELFDYGISRDGRIAYYAPQKRKRIGFMMCQLIFFINEAAIHYKRNNCDPNTVNMKKEFVFHDSMEIPQNKSQYTVFKD